MHDVKDRPGREAVVALIKAPAVQSLRYSEANRA